MRSASLKSRPRMLAAIAVFCYNAAIAQVPDPVDATTIRPGELS